MRLFNFHELQAKTGSESLVCTDLLLQYLQFLLEVSSVVLLFPFSLRKIYYKKARELQNVEFAQIRLCC